MVLPPNPTIVLAERWSTFYNTYARGSYKYPLVNMEEDRNRLKTLRENWLTLLCEASARNNDWPTTKTELDQLMVLLRWDPSKMWKIAKESQIRISAQDKTGNTAHRYTTRRSEVPITQSGQDAQSNPERGLREESHHTTSLRPSIFPFAYIRTFYNELDEASLIPDELKAFAYEQSIKQIDIFYGQASNYCKKLQEALQHCQNNVTASKLYDAFERDHQVLANRLNREWIIAVHDRMRELGITVPEDANDGLDENDGGNNLELAAELLEGSSETQSIFTESNTTIMEKENASQASSSSTKKPESVRSTSRSDDKLLQPESEVETRTRHHRPHGSSNKPKQPSLVVAHEEQHPHPESADRRGAGVHTPNPDNFQRTRLSGPVPEGEIWHNHPPNSELGSRTKAYHGTNYPGRNSSKEGMQVPASPKQSGHREPFSRLESAPLRKETKYAEPLGLKAQFGPRSADIEIRISTPLPYNKIHDSQRYIHRGLIFIPQDSPVQEPRIPADDIFHQPGTQSHAHPDTREDYVVEDHEAFRTGLRDPSTPSYPISTSRRHPSNIPLSKETPASYAASPAGTRHELGMKTESLNHSMGRTPGYSGRFEPEQSHKSFSAPDTVRNVSSASSSNSLPSRQQRSHGPGFPSTSASVQSSDSVPYAESIPRRKSKILQDPQLPHEKATAWHGNTKGRPEYPAKDDQGQQFLSTSTAVELHDTTQDIDWQEVDQMWEHMIENIYAAGVGSCAEPYSQRMANRNHIATDVAADDQSLVSAEEDASLGSSDDSDLTDSDDLDEEIDVYNPMDNPSILPIVNNDRTVPCAEDSRSANAVMNGRSSETRKQSVSWGKVFVYRIEPEILKQRNRTTAQRIQPQSALKRLER